MEKYNLLYLKYIHLSLSTEFDLLTCLCSLAKFQTCRYRLWKFLKAAKLQCLVLLFNLVVKIRNTLISVAKLDYSNRISSDESIFIPSTIHLNDKNHCLLNKELKHGMFSVLLRRNLFKVK